MATATSSVQSATSAPVFSPDAKYKVDAPALAALKADKPWTSDPKYFHTVSYSPAAVLKIMTHCHSGVVNGIEEGGKPLEVMG